MIHFLSQIFLDAHRRIHIESLSQINVLIQKLSHTFYHDHFLSLPIQGKGRLRFLAQLEDKIGCEEDMEEEMMFEGQNGNKGKDLQLEEKEKPTWTRRRRKGRKKEE